MSVHRSLFALAIVIVFSTCQKQQSGNDEQSLIQAVDAYRQPAFDSDRRKEIVAKAASLVDTIFRHHASTARYPGLVYGVVVDDELVLSGATGFTNVDGKIPATTKSLFRIASMTKSFTAMAIVRLRDEGKLDLDEPASTYIMELGNLKYLTDDASPITVQNLLTMTAGFPEDNPWGDRQLADSPEELKTFIFDGISFSNVPSREFEYSNLGYALLGQIITNVSGEPYQKYITANILEPLGMSNTRWEYTEVDPSLLALGYRVEGGVWKEEPLLHDGTYGAMGGLITSVEDFSKYVSLHLSAWPPRNGSDNGPVKRSSLREMHRPWQFRGLDTTSKSHGKLCPATAAYGYGLGWRRNCDGLERLSHSGGLPGFGSEYRFFPEYGLGIICFANLTYAGAGQPNSVIADTLMALGMSHRNLPASDTLMMRSTQIIELLQTWDKSLGNSILAENFYLDKSRELWMDEAENFLKGLGEVVSIEPIVPENQLRGKIRIHGKRQKGEVFFTLTPEKSPKIQELDLRLLTSPAAGK